MEPMASKAGKWINEKKDPRSARWQAGLEEIMDLYRPGLEKGRLTPVCALEQEDLALFKKALAGADLSPGLWAAFLPPSAAGLITPPAGSMDELIRTDREQPSCKILIQRPGQTSKSQSRILCAEISPHARRPGIDIFQDGAFLGNFDYETHEICIQELTRTIRAHAWEKDKWSREHIIAYTVNWLEKVLFLEQADLGVDKKRSFFHSPSLIRTDRVDALFRLLTAVLLGRFQTEPDRLSHCLPPETGTRENLEARTKALDSAAESQVLNLLNQVRALNLIDFQKFTGQEKTRFKIEFARSVRKLSSELAQ